MRKSILIVLGLAMIAIIGCATTDRDKTKEVYIDQKTASQGLAKGMESAAHDRKIDINALVIETQKMSNSVNEMTMVWWIPEEFWRACFKQDPDMTAAQIEQFIEVVRPYTLILVVDGKVGTFGGVKYKSKSIVEDGIKLVDGEGNHYSPLNDDGIDVDTKTFLSMMKPVFVNLLGPVGENLHWFLFPSKDKKGNNIAVAKKEGFFSVKLDIRKFNWRLPLGSILPPKYCPIDREKYSGAWKFCPFHGTELK